MTRVASQVIDISSSIRVFSDFVVLYLPKVIKSTAHSKTRSVAFDAIFIPHGTYILHACKIFVQR